MPPKKRPAIPSIDGGPQTIILAENVERSVEFYSGHLQLEQKDGDEGRYAEFISGEGSALLIVQREGSIAPMAAQALGSGPTKPITFSIPADGHASWKAWLTKRGVLIVRETRWVHGGRSIYLRDPDGRSIELKSPPTVAPPTPPAPPPQPAPPATPPPASPPAA